MKKERRIFTIFIESFNDLGQKQRTEISSSCTRTSVMTTSKTLGIALSYNDPYRMYNEKMYAIEKGFIANLWEDFRVALGEFKHEPLLCIKRVSR